MGGTVYFCSRIQDQISIPVIFLSSVIVKIVTVKTVTVKTVTVFAATTRVGKNIFELVKKIVGMSLLVFYDSK